ncbi:hypothetical protein CNR22_20205 [Sphingobacteriaceae bacterium]|nr:hypothetical protein CNR22_20205 [Sphingobacteriaceae bacterium]
MMRKKNFTLVFVALTFAVSAQDTLSIKKKPAKPHEIGFSVSSVFFLLAGVSDFNERYTNVTYRYLFTEKQAVKLFAGASIFNSEANKLESTKLSSVNNTTLYSTYEKATPSNFQMGLGYEYILGKGKIKHVIGLDLLYNNKFERERTYYSTASDSIDSKGHVFAHTTTLDSGRVNRSQNFDKFGINLNYSLRYQISKRWVITTGLLVSFKTYNVKTPQGTSRMGDTNFNGLISDVSLFYKF